VPDEGKILTKKESVRFKVLKDCLPIGWRLKTTKNGFIPLLTELVRQVRSSRSERAQVP
jgi:hypothetical protein